MEGGFISERILVDDELILFHSSLCSCLLNGPKIYNILNQQCWTIWPQPY